MQYFLFSFLYVALQKAISYIEKDELPPHWDKEIIFAMDEPTTSTESSESASERSEDGDDDDESDEDEQTPEEKDHLVAELYKHMEDKGSPINNTPAINGKGTSRAKDIVTTGCRHMLRGVLLYIKYIPALKQTHFFLLFRCRSV